ncbi:ferritin-like domain-containing protein [Brachybacterium sp. UNK5269]|uniref:ferritin-like domain-containing protein n=1 Tax=Brachybacterium sp. UNK5269 TaxID=3408576 RepID=UPI003BB03DCF
MAFDLEKFTETSEPVGWEDLDFDLFETQPLDANTLRSIRYMCDIEYHTSCNLRDLLVTPSREEPAAAGFMTSWNREEFWHGEALAAVLCRHGIVVDYEELKTKRVKLGWAQALGPLKQSVLSSLVGTDFVAVHMTWGATNELSAVSAYRRLSAMTDHPALSPLLTRIAKQETRHVAFYTTQARQRLEASPRARAATRLALSRAWRPVGSGIMPDSEVTHVMSHLFADRGDEIDALDGKIRKLPGLEDLSIFRDAFRRMQIRM